MIINKTGEIIDGFFMLGHPGVPVYLMDGDNPALVDAGFACLGELYVQEVKKILGTKTRPITNRTLCPHANAFLSLLKKILAEEKGNVVKVKNRIKKIEYDEKTGFKQPEPAYLLNLEARINVVKKRTMKDAENYNEKLAGNYLCGNL